MPSSVVPPERTPRVSSACSSSSSPPSSWQEMLVQTFTQYLPTGWSLNIS